VIWHILEVWALMVAAFAAGCVLGTLLYIALAASPLAPMQVAAADAPGGTFGGLRDRVGMSPELSSDYRRPAPARHFDVTPEPAPTAAAAIREAEWPQATDPVDESIVSIDGAGRPPEVEWGGEPYLDEDEELPARVKEIGAPVLSPQSAALPVAPDPRADLPAMRPLTLPGPRNGVPDNLQRIRGVGQGHQLPVPQAQQTEKAKPQ
jgi:hypothetical protein